MDGRLYFFLFYGSERPFNFLKHHEFSHFIFYIATNHKTEGRTFSLLIWILIMKSRPKIMIMLISKIKITYRTSGKENNEN
jgi:hypothetical protein